MKINRLLITGGAGYVGSHVVQDLLKDPTNHVVVLDNLSTGFKDSIGNTTFVQGDIQDSALVLQILETEKINTVMHFAASTVIPDSIQNPLQYYTNNTMGTINLLQACVNKKIKHFIFSSTAAVYGALNEEKINEQSPTHPLNPYGHSKLMAEQILKDIAHSQELTYVILRYFNVAGASPTGNIGQRTPNATHLIKVAVQTACDKHSSLSIFGTDYPTFDGTCIRDYIHVCDLANAHSKALAYLQQGGQSITLNCGYGHGYSVKEVSEAVARICQRPLSITYEPRRKGDIPKVIADNALIKKVLDWQPQFDDLSLIVKHALDFEKKL